MPYDPSSLMRRIVAPIPVPWGRAKYPFAALPAILTFVAMVLLLVVSCRREASTALFMVDISENTDPNTWVKFWSREFYNGKDTVTVRPWTIPTYNDTAVNTSLTRSLLKTMVLHPIAGVSASMSFVAASTTPIIGFAWMNISLLLTLLLVTATFVLDSIVWTTLKNNYAGLDDATAAKYGPGYFVVLVSLGLTILAVISAFGIRGGRLSRNPNSV